MDVINTKTWPKIAWGVCQDQDKVREMGGSVLKWLLDWQRFLHLFYILSQIPWSCDDASQQKLCL